MVRRQVHMALDAGRRFTQKAAAPRRKDTKRFIRDLDGRHERVEGGTCQLQRSLGGVVAWLARLSGAKNRATPLKMSNNPAPNSIFDENEVRWGLGCTRAWITIASPPKMFARL
jgi:hypothetical protein